VETQELAPLAAALAVGACMAADLLYLGSCCCCGSAAWQTCGLRRSCGSARCQQGSHCRQWVDPIAGKWIADQCFRRLSE
jgi:hypothetical protein